MSIPGQNHRRIGVVLLAALWSAGFGGLLLWNAHLADTHIYDMARDDAIAAFNKDQALRVWASGHGGIYVEIGGQVEPSPYLEHIDERDVLTESGRHLTLVNPATMVQQITGEYGKLYGVEGRLVGKVPLNPDSMADDWEINAIKLFESGVPEVSGFTQENGESYFRLFRPMKANAACLKCHGFQGFKVGDVLGGVGVVVPMAPYERQLMHMLHGNMLSHGLTWLLGMVGLVFWHVRGGRLERQQEMTRAKLIQVEVENRVKSDFMSSMSHELRTPLNAIIGFSGTIKNEMFGPVANDKYREYVDDIHKSGQYLLDLINDILDLSAIESGAVTLDRQPVSFAEVIDQTVRLVEARAVAEDKSISVDVDPDLPMVLADERRIKQILLNLLSNAVKFTLAGGRISIRAQAGDDGVISVCVEDTGIGMSKDELDLALKRFGQATTGLGRRREGSGLGLPLSRELTELNGGQFHISSKKGEGTTVTLRFPRNIVVAEQALLN